MNWFKIAKDFRERNVINAKIRYLEDVKNNLNYLAKFIFQSGKNAKATNYKIISSSKISSYPTLHEILIEADAIALDSPWKFARLCYEGVDKINYLISSLKKERGEITYGNKFKNPQKGWINE